MRVHHLDCATMCPVSRRLVNGDGSLFERGRMVAHCLLVETPSSGLVLVDTGVGTDDLRDPAGRLGGPFTTITGIDAARTTPAIEHVRRLGFDPKDVRHILVTHLDLDHAGGLADFPSATVHVHADEHAAAMQPTFAERERYRACHWAHDPQWNRYASTGEPWKGFAAVRDLPGLPDTILAVPLPGHTRGHACIAVNDGARWLLHAGDAFFHRSAVDPAAPAMPAGLRIFEGLVARDRDRVRDNHRRLRELALANASDVDVFCAHDVDQFARYAARASG